MLFSTLYGTFFNLLFYDRKSVLQGVSLVFRIGLRLLEGLKLWLQLILIFVVD